MIINAKFQSVCPICSNIINVGEKVEWSKGQKAKHEKCFQSEQEKIKEEWENQPLRHFDRIEITEDLYDYGAFGNEEPKLLAPKGTKGEISSLETHWKYINGKAYQCVFINEIVRKNQKPKTKTGHFYAPIEFIKVIKKAKL
jgi:hypothetical protein